MNLYKSCVLCSVTIRFVSYAPVYRLIYHHGHTPRWTADHISSTSGPLPSRTTIFGHRLAGTGHPAICYASYGKRRLKDTCCKRIFHVFEMFQWYVINVSDGCCKSSVSYVAIVGYIYCKCLFLMFHLCVF
jgi:hypothetical protein